MDFITDILSQSSNENEPTTSTAQSSTPQAISLIPEVSNLTIKISTEFDVSLPDSSDLSSDDISYGDEVLASFPEETLSSSPETEEDFFLNRSLSSNLEDQSIIRSVLASDNLQAPSPSVFSMLELINLPSSEAFV